MRRGRAGAALGPRHRAADASVEERRPDVLPLATVGGLSARRSLTAPAMVLAYRPVAYRTLAYRTLAYRTLAYRPGAPTCQPDRGTGSTVSWRPWGRWRSGTEIAQGWPAGRDRKAEDGGNRNQMFEVS